MARKRSPLVNKIPGSTAKDLTEVSINTAGDPHLSRQPYPTFTDGPLEGEPPVAKSKGWWK